MQPMAWMKKISVTSVLFLSEEILNLLQLFNWTLGCCKSLNFDMISGFSFNSITTVQHDFDFLLSLQRQARES